MELQAGGVGSFGRSHVVVSKHPCCDGLCLSMNEILKLELFCDLCINIRGTAVLVEPGVCVVQATSIGVWFTAMVRHLGYDCGNNDCVINVSKSRMRCSQSKG